MKTIDQIAAELPGYDPRALPASAVSAFLDRLVTPVTGVERVGLFDALDRVLADDVVSPINVPPHDNSAMDGFALRGADLLPGQPLRLTVAGVALAGSAWRGHVAAGQCVKIMTGAVMPAGLDTVAPQELVHADGGAIIVPADAVRPGDNRRQLGEDLRAGQPALLKGSLLRPAALGLLASLGLADVPVARRLRVAFFSTGDEILSLGQPPREGAVYDSNRYTLFGLLTRLGVQAIDLGWAPDEPAALRAALTRAAAQADAIITSGGVGMGEADHTKAMMRELGEVAFWHIAMRPGRPMAAGRIARAPGAGEPPHAILFGLPGNPVAVMVTFLAFVRPALLRMMGARPAPPVLLRAACETALRKKPGRTEYQRGIVTQRPDGRLSVRAAGNQGSGVLSSMARANGLIVLDHEQGNVAAGSEVGVMMFEGVI
jgi:molybdopterin molybdotransferase